MAFHQIELDSHSRDTTTFVAPESQYKKLFFGVDMTTEKFT